jgi:hypothetical protein
MMPALWTVGTLGSLVSERCKMMTREQITAAVLEIRARPSKEEVNNPKPVPTPWAPTPPFVALANPHAMRGHVEAEPGQCKRCKEVRPPGGYPAACKRGDVRTFQGG